MEDVFGKGGEWWSVSSQIKSLVCFSSFSWLKFETFSASDVHREGEEFSYLFFKIVDFYRIYTIIHKRSEVSSCFLWGMRAYAIWGLFKSPGILKCNFKNMFLRTDDDDDGLLNF